MSVFVNTRKNNQTFLFLDHESVTMLLIIWSTISGMLIFVFIYFSIFFFEKKNKQIRTNNYQNRGDCKPKGGFYRQPERHLQPIAGVCERCRQQQSNTISWAAPGISHWGTPPKLTAIQQRSFRGPFHPNDELF